MVMKTKKTMVTDRKGKIELTITKDYDKKYSLGFKEISRTEKRIN